MLLHVYINVRVFILKHLILRSDFCQVIIKMSISSQVYEYCSSFSM